MADDKKDDTKTDDKGEKGSSKPIPRQGWFDRLIENVEDGWKSNTGFLKFAGVVGALFYGLRYPRSHDQIERLIDMGIEGVEDGRLWLDNQRRQVQNFVQFFIGFIAVLAIIPVGAALLSDDWREKIAITFFTVLFLYWVVLRSWLQRMALEFIVALGGAWVKVGNRLRVYLKASKSIEIDFGADSAIEAIDRLINQVEEKVLDSQGKAFWGGVHFVQQAMKWIYRFPMRIAFWWTVGAIDLALVPYHYDRGLVWLGLSLAVLLVMGITGWEKERDASGKQTDRPEKPAFFIRFAGWGLIAIAVDCFRYPVFAILAGDAASGRPSILTALPWLSPEGSIDTHLMLFQWLVLFPLLGGWVGLWDQKNVGVRTWIKYGVAVLVASFLFADTMAKLRTDSTGVLINHGWRDRLFFIGAVIAGAGALWLLLKHRKPGQAIGLALGVLAIIVVFLMGGWLYHLGSGHRGLWGAQFNYDEFAAAQARQAKAAADSVIPVSPTTPVPPSSTPAKPPTPQSSFTPPRPTAQASVLPVPTVPVVDDTLRQVLSPGMTPWRTVLRPGVYHIKYTGRMLYTTARPVYEWRDGAQVLVYPTVDSTGGKIPVSRRLRPKDYPMPDGMVGDPYIRFFDKPREYHRLSGTRWDPITISHEVVAEIGQNTSNWPIWEGNGSLCVTIVKVY